MTKKLIEYLSQFTLVQAKAVGDELGGVIVKIKNTPADSPTIPLVDLIAYILEKEKIAYTTDKQVDESVIPGDIVQETIHTDIIVGEEHYKKIGELKPHPLYKWAWMEKEIA